MTGRNGNRQPARRPLTDLQQAILDFIWSAGSATADQVREGLQGKHPLKDSTVRTLLRRLEARGYLSHDVDGKTFVYRAAAGPRSLAARTVRQLIDRFWAGSAEQFLVGMIDEKIVAPSTLTKLAGKVKRAKRRAGT